MATLTITVAAGNEAGATLRHLGRQIENAVQAAGLPDRNPTGASVVLTIDNNPAVGTATVQITGGPYQNATALPV